MRLRRSLTALAIASAAAIPVAVSPSAIADDSTVQPGLEETPAPVEPTTPAEPTPAPVEPTTPAEPTPAVLSRFDVQASNPNWEANGWVETVPYQTSIGATYDSTDVQTEQSLTFGTYENGGVNYSINGGAEQRFQVTQPVADAIDWVDSLNLVPPQAPEFGPISHSFVVEDTTVNASWTGNNQ